MHFTIQAIIPIKITGAINTSNIPKGIHNMKSIIPNIPLNIDKIIFIAKALILNTPPTRKINNAPKINNVIVNLRKFKI